tara:strand:+ start:784 stop:987 length:204 start_codon:yes stop_codon:yes gene_type:complete
MKVMPVNRTAWGSQSDQRQSKARLAAEAISHSPSEDDDKFFETLFAHFTKDEMKEIFELASEIRGTA